MSQKSECVVTINPDIEVSFLFCSGIFSPHFLPYFPLALTSDMIFHMGLKKRIRESFQCPRQPPARKYTTDVELSAGKLTSLTGSSLSGELERPMEVEKRLLLLLLLRASCVELRDIPKPERKLLLL